MSQGSALDASPVSGSRDSGSSTKNFGAAVWTATTSARSASGTRRTGRYRVAVRSVEAAAMRATPSEHCTGRKDQVETFITLREVDAQRRGQRAMQPDPDAVVALELREIEIGRPAGHLARIIENCGVQEVVHEHPPLGLQ